MSEKKHFFSELKNDLPAAVIVFLVAVPLCLGIALASGVPLFAGIIAGIIGGIVVGLVSGSPLGVSGPAAGLVAIVLTAIEDLGAFEIFLFATAIAGVIQLVLGLLRAGIIGYYFPNSVIKGMLSGIGIIIILKQIPHAFGYDKDYEGDLAFSQQDGENTFSEIVSAWEYITSSELWTSGAIVITLISLAIMILWEQKFMKRIRLFQLIQGPLVVVLTGIGLGILFEGIDSLRLNTNPEFQQMVSLPVPDSLAGFFGQFTMPDFSAWNKPQVYVVAFTIAVVASLETLLCVEATDKLDPEKRVTPTNRELIAQGTGNIVSGLIGGLPITQVIVRSSANIQSGGKTKASAVIHGFLLLGTAMFIPAFLNMIPLASLAAILFVVGYKLAKPAIFKQMYQLGLTQFAPFIATILGILLTDLLVGIGIGMAVAIFFILYQQYLRPYYFDPETHKDGDVIRIELAEDVNFLHKAAIQRTLYAIPDGSKVIIDASRSITLPPDVRDIIQDYLVHAKLTDIDATVLGWEDEQLVNHAKSFHQTVKGQNGAQKSGGEKQQPEAYST